MLLFLFFNFLYVHPQKNIEKPILHRMGIIDLSSAE